MESAPALQRQAQQPSESPRPQAIRRGRHLRLRRLFQRRRDHRNQRIRRYKRLLQHAVRADSPRFLFIQRIERANQQNYGDFRKPRIFLYVLADFVSIAHGHEHIGQHDVRIQIRQAPHRRFAIADGDDINPMFFERQRNHLLDVAVVVGDQNPGHLISPLGAPRLATHHRLD